MTYPPIEPARSRYGKGFWFVAMSVLLNCFLLGLIAAGCVLPHRHHGGPDMFVEAMANTLSPKDAETLRHLYEEREDVLDEGHRDMDSAMHQLGLVLIQPEVNPATLQQSLDAITAHHKKIEAAMAEIVRHAATDLSPEGRRVFARDGLRPPGPPPGHGRDDCPPPPQGDNGADMAEPDDAAPAAGHGAPPPPPAAP